ncbi:TPA: hypothetical protein EYP66_06440 [Candidatus Poribacteria bacterium]|nr:hypothetical protein [Candidatus Poribacteria bacterium]
MSKVATFEFNTDQTSESIIKKLLSLGFDCQVVKIPTGAEKKKGKRSLQPSLMNQKQYLLYLSEHDYRGKKGSYLSMLVQIAKYLLEITNSDGIYYYRNDMGEEFDEQNTKYIRTEEITSYPPDMNEPYPTRYFIPNNKP